MAAFGANEAVGPAHSFEIFGASIIVREYALKFRETGGKAAWVHRGG